nr:transposase [uncultured Emticicia sp.]
MNDKFQNKYRIDSARLQNWDYRNNAAYFVTICTANREHYFGYITNGKMNLSLLGSTVNQEWLKSIELRPDMNLSLGEYVVMPNHFHAIIFIDINKYNSPSHLQGLSPNNQIQIKNSISDLDHTNNIVDINDIKDCNDNNGVIGNNDNDANQTNIINHDIDMDNINVHAAGCRDAMHGVSTNPNPNPNPNNNTLTGNTFGPQSKNLGSIIRGFKSSVTTFARKNDIPFQWQTRYHDHIIRNETEFSRISNYILNNPSKWQDDKFYS